MQLGDFRGLVERLHGEVPDHYLDGVVAVEVSPKAVPHPLRAGVYTMGECIPVETGGDTVTSRVVLYHGSFQALAAERPEFDWRGEAWDTLLHELRHHIEGRANAADLEHYDWAAEQNFRRTDGEAFDPLFHLAGERLDRDVFQVDDDVFWDIRARVAPPNVEIPWHGRRYGVDVPRDPLPVFLSLEGLEPAPAGDAVVVLRRPPGLFDLFRPPAQPTTRRVRARPLG
ncbi:MAG TPA: hypothetical protein VF970_12495 [Gemmatimonadales bacterium]